VALKDVAVGGACSLVDFIVIKRTWCKGYGGAGKQRLDSSLSIEKYEIAFVQQSIL
jgi:hypothetical protein